MSATPKFEIYRDAAEKFRFRLKAAKGGLSRLEKLMNLKTAARMALNQ